MNLHCSVCPNDIPDDRLRRHAGTCSKECEKLERKFYRDRKARTKCRLCHKRIPLSKRIMADLEIALNYYASEDSAGCGVDRQVAIDALRELQGYKDRVEARRKAKDRKARSGAVLSEHNTVHESAGVSR